MDDIRLAVRRLRQRPLPTLASIVTLAGAIGATAATWSLLSALLLHPLPVRDAASLVLVGRAHHSGFSAGRVATTFIYPEYQQVLESQVFDSVAGGWLSPLPFTIAGESGGAPAMVAFVSGGFFGTIGVDMRLGRSLTPNDDRRGAAPAAVVSDQFWRTRLGSDPGAIGRVITLVSSMGPPLAGTAVTIVGVAPPKFRGLTLSSSVAIYLPLETIADVGPRFTNYFATPTLSTSPTAGVTIVGRLRSGQSPSDAAARIAMLPHLGQGPATTTVTVPINETAIPGPTRLATAQYARFLSGTVALLLLIGCATAGMLLLVRTESRRVEFATCLALGATRSRLARGIVIEGAILAIAAALLSPFVAWWIFSLVGAYQLPGGIGLAALGLELDPSAVAVVAGAALLSTLVIAVLAGVLGFRPNIADSLRLESGGTPRASRRATRGILLATQTAVALALVAGTGLFARSLLAALDLNARFDSAKIASATIQLSRQGYDAPRAEALYRQLVERTSDSRAIAAIATSFQGGGMGAKGILKIDGESREFPYFVAFRHVDTDYFSAMRMRLLAGRPFDGTDRAGAPQVAIVSESFGRMIAAGGDPIGRRIAVMMGGAIDAQIVGVTEDLFTTTRDPEPLALYLPIGQTFRPAIDRTVVVRARGDVDAARRELSGVLATLAPTLDVARAETIDERLLRELAPQQFGMVVLGTLGSIALVLTLLATYVLAESMAITRTRELGIRAALGATRATLVAIVVREAAVLTGIGIVAGLFIAWAGAGTLQALLFRVEPLDPVTLGAVALLILTLTLAVSLRPALRAARVDLARLLRAG